MKGLMQRTQETLFPGAPRQQQNLLLLSKLAWKAMAAPASLDVSQAKLDIGAWSNVV